MKIKLSKYFVDVILPLALPKTYTYELNQKEAFIIKPGFRVAVQFGKQKIYTAIVKKVHSTSPKSYEPKPISMIMDDYPLVTNAQLNFWEWISNYYMCTEGEVLRSSLPSALLIESKSIIIIKEAKRKQIENLSDIEFIIYEALQKSNLTIDQIIKITDTKKVMPLVLGLIEKKVAAIEQSFEEKYKPKKQRVVRLNKDCKNKNKLEQVFETLKKAPKQRAVLMDLLKRPTNLNSWTPFIKLTNGSNIKAYHLKSLIDKGLLDQSYQEINRVLVKKLTNPSEEKKLSQSQEKALHNIKQKFKEKKVILLEGVTSSGKTEVYIKLIKTELKKGNQILYLLPEISLTSQIVQRLTSHFREKVLVYHSKFSIHERTEVWNQVLKNDTAGSIIVGARSSLLLPFKNLSLLIVDEEHENSFKQFDPSPRYQARDSAIYLARNLNAKVILGSATPSIETAENARNGKYGWVKLKERYGGVELPKIELVNLKAEYQKNKMSGIFSKQLLLKIKETIDQRKQVILFQNRRGYAPILECLCCGYSPKCVQCDVSLTYHQTMNKLKCHYCGYNINMPNQCNACGMTSLNKKGVGTQQIEEQIKKIFPNINVARMDWDSTRGKWDFDNIIEKFHEEKIQILVGTQMVVKGLDFKNVLLVGVINADNILNFPDFRAHERSYQMLTQVAGRAGRLDKKGKVIIQTFQPDHPVLLQVLNYDYEQLFQTQKKERINYRYPPFYRMIKITFKCRHYENVNKASDWFSNVIKSLYKGTILGPVFPAIMRVRNQYQKQLIIKLDHDLKPNELKKLLMKTYKSFQTIGEFKSTRVNFDVDPY
ncbi:primosomal protein N' [Bacteroidetes bacterium SCGC AAA795-G10]|nr:primosomal protein N' [Bacteroidetes bacterium SCGC AAA795-G10]